MARLLGIGLTVLCCLILSDARPADVDYSDYVEKVPCIWDNWMYVDSEGVFDAGEDDCRQCMCIGMRNFVCLDTSNCINRTCRGNQQPAPLRGRCCPFCTPATEPPVATSTATSTAPGTTSVYQTETFWSMMQHRVDDANSNSSAASGCEWKGHHIAAMTTFFSHDRPCESCLCKSNGDMTCNENHCSLPRCTEGQDPNSPDHCCPVCYTSADQTAEGACEFLYPNPEFDCPQINCTESEIEKVPEGQCCPICVPVHMPVHGISPSGRITQVCRFDNRLVPEGRVETGDPCRMCICEQGKREATCITVKCTRKRCNRGFFLKRVEHKCCPVCRRIRPYQDV